MNVFRALSDLEANDHIHLARLLILLGAFSGAEGTGMIEGLTKLAKLDFLLRYPTYLERALRQRNKPTRKVQVAEYERLSVESSMVRFRYGPWDFRYRRFINLLVAKGLAKVDIKGKTVQVGLTSSGVQAADKLSSDERFGDLARRARLLKTHFNYKGTRLMKMIYRIFPEIATLRFGEEIRP